MLRIIYDARYLPIDDRYDGVGRYSAELAHGLATRDDTEMIWLVHDKAQLEKLPAGKSLIANNPQDALRELFWLPRFLNRQKCDIVYSPFFIMGTLGLKHPLILTIHDMIYFTHRTPPYHLPWWVRLGWRAFHLTYWPLRLLLNRAGAIATVSATAKKELEDADATKRPIATVLNAVRHDVTARPADHSASRDIVYMGAFTPYKNVECLIDSLEELPDMRLHLLSKIIPEREQELVDRASERGVEGQLVFHRGVSDEKYHELLRTSRCLVTASRLEGFGLPVIEAQQYGAPVVCSDIPIFHEVGAHSILYFDPDSPSACARAIKKLADKATSADYVRRGMENAKRFSWDKSAEAAVTLCQSLLEK